MAIRKDQIAMAFSKGAKTYDQAAQLQNEVSLLVAARAFLTPLPSDPDILEIGCGTGQLTRLLLDGCQDGNFLITDIAKGMLDQCQKNIDNKRVSFAQMDGEHPNLGDQKFDLIASSLTFQWFHEPEQSLTRLTRMLNPGGKLVFSTLGPETFIEWREAHQKLGLSSGIPDFTPASALSSMCLQERNDQINERYIKRSFDDTLAFARMLKAIGANTPVAGHRPLSASHFKKLSQILGDNFTVTYHVVFGSFQAEN